LTAATKIFEGLGPSTLIPQRGKVSAEQLSSLGAEEGFVLSRVDGHTTLEEICLLVPFAPPVTQVILRKLAEIGAIEVPGVPRTLPRQSGTKTPAMPEKPAPILSAEVPTKPEKPVKPGHDVGSPAPRPSAEQSGLSTEAQRRVDAFFADLEQRDAYRLLEIDPSADAREVKRAYFKLSKEFHPDRYFQKDIGPYRDKLSKIFQAVKGAFELLSDPNRRRAYEESAGLKKEK
jgi:hypothetical protein